MKSFTISQRKEDKKTAGTGVQEGGISVNRTGYGDSMQVTMHSGNKVIGFYRTSVYQGKIQVRVGQGKTWADCIDAVVIADQKALFLAAFGGAVHARCAMGLDDLGIDPLIVDEHSEGTVAERAISNAAAAPATAGTVQNGR